MLAQQDPFWFRTLSLVIPGVVGGASAIVGVLVANRFAKARADQELRDRELERKRRMLEPLFQPLYSAYSDIYRALLDCQTSLNRYATQERGEDLPEPRELENTLHANALWLTNRTGPLLFDAADAIRQFCSNPCNDVSEVVEHIVNCQAAIRCDLGIESFHESWARVVLDKENAT